MPSKDNIHDQIGALYADPSISVAEIATRHGITKDTVYALRRRYDWPSRKGMAKSPAAAPEAPRKGSEKPAADEQEGETRPAIKRSPPAANYTRLRNRAKAILAQQIEKIEAGLDTVEAEAAGKGAADRERDARTLASLTRTLEMLRDQEAQEKAAKAGKTTKRAKRSLNEIRQDLERRLARLVEGAEKG